MYPKLPFVFKRQRSKFTLNDSRKPILTPLPAPDIHRNRNYHLLEPQIPSLLPSQSTSTMHLPTYTLAAILCAFPASALPLPLPRAAADAPVQPDFHPEKIWEIRGGPIRREDMWRTLSPTDPGNNDPVTRRRDSPLHSLPGNGVVGIEGPGPVIEDPH